MKRRHSMTDSVENSSKNIKRQPSSTSFLMLNDFCLLQIIKYLELDDFINISKTCKRLKSLVKFFNEVYSEFKIHVNMDNKRTDYMEHIISNINDNITEISINYQHSKIPMNVLKMTKCCANIKNLILTNWTVTVTEADYDCLFENLETLTMKDCDFRSASSFFFEIFRGLRFANLFGFRYLSNKHVERLFRKNPSIEAFVWMGDMETFEEFEMFVMVPKLTALSLRVDREINDLDLCSIFNNLTKLQLYCNGDNISEFLHKLAKSTAICRLKELDILRVRVDDLFFYALYYFQNLELLAISTWSFWFLTSPLDWPQKLKRLRLESFILSRDGFISTIKQLECIENIDLGNCTVEEADRLFFEDLDILSQEIDDSLGDHDRKKLNFILNVGYDMDCDRLLLIDTERFRIFNENCVHVEKDHLGISIRFPGIDDNIYL